MLSGNLLSPWLMAHNLYTACNKMRAVFRNCNHRFPVLISILYLINGIAERARGAFLDGLDDFFNIRTVGINPGFFTQFENRGQTVGAESDV